MTANTNTRDRGQAGTYHFVRQSDKSQPNRDARLATVFPSAGRLEEKRLSGERDDFSLSVTLPPTRGRRGHHPGSGQAGTYHFVRQSDKSQPNRDARSLPPFFPRPGGRRKNG